MIVNIALLTVTDTRTFDNDKSGAILVKKIEEANHNLIDRKICKDNKEDIVLILKEWIEKDLFEILFFFVLVIAGIFLLIESKSFNKNQIIVKQIPKILSIFIGSLIGFVSGIVGIGGGIFLSPFLFLMKAGYPKHIATTASLFILINSIFGVAGQLTKDIVFNEFLNFWPLFLAVLIGGQIGNFLNIKFLSNKTLVLITSLLVILVAIRMGFKILS